MEEEAKGEREEGLVGPSSACPSCLVFACMLRAPRGGGGGGRAGERQKEREREGEKSGYLFPIYVSGTRRASVVPTTQRSGRAREGASEGA